MQGFYKTYLDILETIDDCIQKNRIVPSLILLFTAINSFSNVTNKSTHQGKMVFKNWVKKWMIPQQDFNFDENDVYAARCGLLHAQISESDLSREQKAK